MKMNFTNDVNGRLLYAVHSIFEHGANRANNCIGDTDDEKRQRTVPKDGGYKCIHFDPFQFCNMLGSVLEHQSIWKTNEISDLKFIDVGCGIGEKIYLANLFGLKAFGLELREELIKEGKQLLTSMGFGSHHWSQPALVDCFIQGDALKYDYKDFDILYFYCPLANDSLQRKLEKQIASTAKPGAIVIPASPLGCFEGWGNVHKDLPKDWQFAMVNNTGYFVREA